MNDAAGPEGISEVAHHFLAGLLEHGPALMAFFNPTTNAYRRIHPEALVPTLVSWGHDNRLTLARVPRERGNAHAVEFRVGDGAANPYLVVAGALFAGLDGIKRKLEPPAPDRAGLIYERPRPRVDDPAPRHVRGGARRRSRPTSTSRTRWAPSSSASSG